LSCGGPGAAGPRLEAAERARHQVIGGEIKYSTCVVHGLSPLVFLGWRALQLVTMGSLIAPDHFTHILRIANTNVDGRNKIMYAMTNIRGIGRRFSNFACKKGEVDMRKRAGECSAEDIENLMLIVQDPQSYKTPTWFVNRQRVRHYVLALAVPAGGAVSRAGRVCAAGSY
jgi:ribosomal protein S13